MAALRYNESDQMPDYLRSAAQKNLGTEDASISKFNDRARMFPMQTDVQKPASVQRSSFSFNLNGGNDSQQLSLSGIPSSATSNGVPQTQAANGGGDVGGSAFRIPSQQSNQLQPNGADNWRFKSFGPSQLDNFSGGHVGDTFKDAPTTQSLAFDAKVYSQQHPGQSGAPDANHEAISNYQPKDMSKEREQYGWGGGGQ